MTLYSLSLTIEADDISKFTEVLGFRRDLYPNRNPRHTNRHWRHYFVKKTDCDIEEEIGKALEQCQPFHNDFREWADSGAYIELYVVITSSSNVGFAIGPEAVSRAAKLRINIGFDFYPE